MSIIRNAKDPKMVFIVTQRKHNGLQKLLLEENMFNENKTLYKQLLLQFTRADFFEWLKG